MTNLFGHVDSGDDIVVETEAGLRRLVIRPKDAQPLEEGEIDEEFARQVAEFIDQYRPALEELAK